jgi:hypothetical protein
VFPRRYGHRQEHAGAVALAGLIVKWDRVVAAKFRTAELLKSVVDSVPNRVCDRPVVGVIKRSTIRTGHLRVFLPLQLRPINPVVFRGSQCMSNLKGGFTLICFQRLSLPRVATQRWT